MGSEADKKKSRKSVAKNAKSDVYTKKLGKFIENLLQKEVAVEESDAVVTNSFDVDAFKDEFGKGDV